MITSEKKAKVIADLQKRMLRKIIGDIDRYVSEEEWIETLARGMGFLENFGEYNSSSFWVTELEGKID